MDKQTLEKIFEYASMPVHGTLSRRIRKGVKIRVNNDEVIEDAVLFLGEQFVRITRSEGGDTVNTYYDWDGITQVTTRGSGGE
jgi:hypothetical protein